MTIHDMEKRLEILDSIEKEIEDIEDIVLYYKSYSIIVEHLYCNSKVFNRTMYQSQCKVVVANSPPYGTTREP